MRCLIGAIGVACVGVDAHAQPLSEEDQRLLDSSMAAGETIEIVAERPDKPFDRDTEVRLTGKQLAERGAVDLATALALLPDVTVRDAGRGGMNVDIRGARKGAVSIFVDGVLVSDPYYGSFDVTTIPITDIVQIRVATTPQSPIDGPGGTGGVIEVHTRDAVGAQVVIARVTADSLPSFGTSGTARVTLAKRLALRVAASGLAGARDLELPTSSVGEARRASTGSARLEYRKDTNRRVVIDAFLDDRHYIAPPSDTMTSSILMIDRETTMRVSALGDHKIGKLQLHGQSWAHALQRRSRYFVDPSFTNQLAVEDLTASRAGGRVLMTSPFKRDFRWAASATLDREHAVADNLAGDISEGEVTMLEVAADGQYERGRLRVDAAAGVAIPTGVDAGPWPEGKLVGKLRPVGSIELTATLGYKGRTPTLRERFDAATGNPAVGPEHARHAELRAIWDGLPSVSLGSDVRPRPRVHVEAAPFARKTTGSTRVCPSDQVCEPALVGKIINLDDVFFYGIDTQVGVHVHRNVELGGSYSYVKACQLDAPRGCDVGEKEMGGADAIDRLPRHRGDVWAKLATTRVSAIARVRFLGPAYEKRIRSAGYAQLEANVSVHMSRAYLAVLRIDDATDVRPETRAGYHGPGRVVTASLQGTWD